jgi:DNA-binding NtrC family response regulator
MHSALLLASEGEIKAHDLRFNSAPGESKTAPLDIISSQLQRLFCEAPPNMHHQLEELIVRHAFAFCSSNQVQTAKLLGMSRNALRTLLKRFNVLNAETEPVTYEDLDSLDDDNSYPAVN